MTIPNLGKNKPDLVQSKPGLIRLQKRSVQWLRARRKVMIRHGTYNLPGKSNPKYFQNLRRRLDLPFQETSMGLHPGK